MDEGEADSGIEMVAGGVGDVDPGKDDAGPEISEEQPDRGCSNEKTENDSGDSKQVALDDDAGATPAVDDDVGATPAVEADDADDAGATPAVDEDDAVFIRVFIHDQNLQRCYKFQLDEVVFNAKRKVR